MIALAGLFIAALTAATLIPAQSEAVLVALILYGDHPVWVLVAVATAGNVLGSIINWLIGRAAARLAGSRWLPVGPKALDRATLAYRRWGYWSLLLSWMPVIGDPLTVVAGLLREPLWRFTLLVFLAKGGRYAALAALAPQLV